VTSSANPLLVEAWRGGTVESAHRGALVVVDADGRTVLALGDTDRSVFPRSAVKALQALPLVAGGAADALGLTDAELAIACASHNGEPRHAATSAAMLAKAGVDVDALECGTHWPYLDTAVRALVKADAAPSALHNNCSGKHAGFVCLGCLMAQGQDVRGFVRGYVGPDHAVMREVTAALSTATGVDVEHASRGTDGCSIPTYAIPLRALAIGFARFGTGHGLRADHAHAAQRLRAAVAAEPFMVAGTGRFDTRVMERLGTRVFCKVGAEAVYCAAFPGRGLGLALKIDDGATARAAEVAMAAAIEACVDLSDDEAVFVRGLSDLTLRNWRGTEVGALRATDTLRAALQGATR
jgi:L-asparaginase II